MEVRSRAPLPKGQKVVTQSGPATWERVVHRSLTIAPTRLYFWQQSNMADEVVLA